MGACLTSRLDGRNDLQVKIALWEGIFPWNSVTMIPLATRRYLLLSWMGKTVTLRFP